MRSGKTRAFVLLALLALGSALLLPSATAMGKKKKKKPKGIAQRVGVLEDEVAELTERVAALEAGSCTCICDVLHLVPLADFPEEPSEGDVCVVGESGSQGIYSYLNGDWWQMAPLGPPCDDPPCDDPE